MIMIVVNDEIKTMLEKISLNILRSSIQKIQSPCVKI